MLMRLIRQPTTDEGTFGLLSLPARALSWVSLELPWRDNEQMRSCIRPGPGEGELTYRCSLRQTSKWSPRDDRRLFGVNDVEGRTDILLHAANYGGDIDLGWHTDLLGCIAPGMRFGKLKHPEVGHEQSAILGSRTALAEAMAELGDEDFDLVVSWA